MKAAFRSTQIALSFMSFWACASLQGTTSTCVAASPPDVKFNAARQVACREVTTPEFAAANPREKQIEAVFRLSMLIDGDPAKLDEALIVFSSPMRRLAVADFAPRSESVTDIVGPIERSESQDASRSLQFGLGGTVGAKHEIATAQVSPSASSGLTEQECVKESYKVLPERKLLVASGVVHGDQGVFFKLKPSTQEPLEGEREFRCIFVVPKSWRGDWLAVHCLARGQSRRQFTTQIEECGRAQFIIGLYLEGDPSAKRLARLVGDLQARSSDASVAAPFVDAGGSRDANVASTRPSFSGLIKFYRQAFRLTPSTDREAHSERPPTLEEACEALGRLSGDAAALPPELSGR